MALESDLKVELVQVLFRHGARTICRSETVLLMPQYVDPSLLETFGYEQLTNTGKAQVYNLGCMLRKRYNDFLSPLYKPDDIYAYSSDYDRTKTSLQLVLAGLYPPAPEQTWNKNLKWQPIPTHHVPRRTDVLLMGVIMHKYESAMRSFEETPQYKEAMKTLEGLYDFFQSKGIDALQKLGFLGILGMFNVLLSHKASKGKLPDWITENLYENLKEKVVLYFDLLSATPELNKWSIGPLVRKFVENMNVKGEIANPKKIYLYSGHEMNVAAYARAHGIKEFRYPDYSSAVILEKLRDSQNRLYVRMLAYTGNNDTFLTLKLGNYEEYCPIEEYMKIVKDVIPSDEEIDSMCDISNELKTLHLNDALFKSKKDPSESIELYDD